MQCGAETDWRFSFERNGEILTCPWHAIEFDLTTGRALYWPKLKARTFPVRVLGGELCVDLSVRRDVAEEQAP
jgi:nitrite reductase/ring-hydroxylating ferredoxin subunit